MGQGRAMNALPHVTGFTMATLFPALLFLALGVIASPAQDAAGAPRGSSPEVRAALSRQQAGLLALLGTNADLQSQQELRKALTEPGKLDAAPVLPLLHAVLDAGLHPGGSASTSGFIEAEPVLDVLIAALADETPEIRSQAFRYLVAYAPPDRLASRAATVLAALDRHSWPDGARLKALLPLDPALRVQLLNQPGLAPEIAARLGDATAETELIERWRKATDYQDLVALAARLGYVGSPAAARALLERFASPIHLDAPVEQRSIRAELIAALGRIHPREPLLTTTLQTRLQAGDGDGAAVQAYLRQVAEWARRDYSVAVSLPTEPPWLAEKIIAKRFPRKAAQP